MEVKMTYEPQKMLVTGGAGFIGSHFIRQMLNLNTTTVINFDLLTYAGSLTYLQNLPNQDRYHFIQGDICDAKLIHKILNEFQVDTIVHFAAESHVDRSIASPDIFISTNVSGTFVLLEAAKNFWVNQKKWGGHQCRFHHISTDEVYGSLELTDPPFTEHSSFSPRSPYAASKASADHLVLAYCHTFGLPITISHCSNNYGPHQHAEKLIPTIIRACFHQKKIPIYGAGKNIRDWLHVADHCNAIFTILKNGKAGERYNVGGNNEWSNLTLAQFICEHMDDHHPKSKPHHSLIDFVSDRMGHDFRYSINADKIQKELGWQAHTPFKEGLGETIRYYVEKF